MKQRSFVIIPFVIIVFIALCVGAVFATAYLIPGQYTEKYVPEDELSIESPFTKKSVSATLFKERGEIDGSYRYFDENGDSYLVRDGKIVGVRRSSKNIQGISTKSGFNIDAARNAAYDFFKNEEGFNDYVLTEEKTNDSNCYQFEFRQTYGKDNAFESCTSYTIEFSKDGTIRSWNFPGTGMDGFNPASVADLTADDVYAYCDEQINGEFEIDRMMIEEYDGIFKIGCRCLIDDGRDFVVVRYPIG